MILVTNRPLDKWTNSTGEWDKPNAIHEFDEAVDDLLMGAFNPELPENVTEALRNLDQDYIEEAIDLSAKHGGDDGVAWRNLMNSVAEYWAAQAAVQANKDMED